jgi:hypothetical protein
MFMATHMPTYVEQVKTRNQALIKRMSPITHDLTIKREKGKWVVTALAGSAWRGLDSVRWTLVSDDDDVTAHFQFADMDLFEKSPDLTPDKTAKIAGTAKSLTLKIDKDACRRTNPHYYAVWIIDKKLKYGGGYAVGPDLNPPPEITVGP